MKIERIRKNHKKKIIIGVVIVLAIVSTITLTMSKSKYRLTQSMKLVTGTINYKVPDMRIVAVNISEDGTNYEIANEIPESGYTLNEERSMCKVATETSGIENASKDNNITIEYIEGKLNIIGVSKRNTRCYLYFDKKKLAGETIIASMKNDFIKEGTPNFTKTATGAETEDDNGIYKTSDLMYGGDSYYWRGAATTNHLIFADKCWRIIRINGDRTIRLIYNGTVETENTCAGNGSNSGSIAVAKQTYNANSYRSEYVGYTYTEKSQRSADNNTGIASNLKTQTDNWLNNNDNFTDAQRMQIADGKFCNDRNTVTGSTWSTQGSKHNYAAQGRMYTNKKPIISCSEEDIYILKAGAITADEVAFAGGVSGEGNSFYYLYNNTSYWTMSPYSWDSGAYVFLIRPAGQLNTYTVDDINGIRPVINLRSDVTFNSGSDGTQNNPYIVQ